jgi:hypothetical protein
MKKVVVTIGIVVAVYLWYKHEQYESEKKEKKLSQEELDAIIKFIKK